ncbi:MAG: ribonuclease P protein component, partial [Acidimicrobiales bacterium]
MTPIRDRTTFRTLRRPAGRAARGPVAVAYVPPAPASARAGAVFSQVVPGAGGEPEAADAAVTADGCRVGFAVGKACGNAVVRNRIRRRFRAAVREAAGSVPPGSYLLRGDAPAATVPFGSLVTAVREAMAGAAARAGVPAPE